MKRLMVVVMMCSVIFSASADKIAAGQEDVVLDEVLNVMSKKYYPSFDKEACREEIKRALFDAFRVEKSTDCMDPYFDYLSKKDLEEHMSTMRAGSYTGIGVKLGNSSEGVRILEVIEGGPADKVGIKKGDILISAKEENATKDTPIKKVNDTEFFKGPEGTKFVISVRRAKKTLVFSVTLGRVELKDVRFKKLDNGILYIAIKEFLLSKTPRDFFSAMEQADAENPRVIIDLRNNPGGLASLVFEIIKNLNENPEDVIITRQYRDMEKIDTVGGQRKWYYWANNVFMPTSKDTPGYFSHYKVVILADGNSASAAEIFAGALKDWGFPTVGETTYGKGVAQLYFKISNGHVLKLTVFEYRVGNTKTKVNGIGVKPDYAVKDSRGNMEDTATAKDRQFMKAVEILQKK